MTEVLPLSTLILLGALTLVPFLFMASTSFVKLSFVFSILRNALGTGEVPSGMVITALALILSLYVMLPVGAEMAQAAGPVASRISTTDPLGAGSREALWEAVRLAEEPLRAFLERNSGKAERALFLRLGTSAQRGRQPALESGDLLIVLPAFLITELKEAFQIGFFVFLPFLVIDLVVASLAAALGLQNMPTSTLAMPFKLLLFVLVDGFYVLSEALIRGYV